MQGNVIVRTGPGAEPVSLVEAKLQCRADADLTDEDTLITSLIAAARGHVESATNRVMVTQGMRSTFPCFPGGSSIVSVLNNFIGGNDSGYIGVGRTMKLRAPLRKVTSITYRDSANVSQTLAASIYDVDTSELPGIVSLGYAQVWPTTYYHPAAVSVNFTSGYATPFTVDAATNILTAAGHPFANGDIVRGHNTGGALPAGLSVRTDYYAIGVSGNTLQLSLTEGGAAIDITGTGTGTHFIGGADDSAWVAMRQAMLLLIEHWYRNRGESSDFQTHQIPMGVAALVGSHKVWNC